MWTLGVRRGAWLSLGSQGGLPGGKHIKADTSTTDGSLRVYLDAPCSLQTKLLTTASGDPTLVHVFSPASSPSDRTRPMQPGALME